MKKKNITNILKGLGLAALLLTCNSVRSADLYFSSTGAANTVSNVLSAGGYLLKSVYWVNTSTNVALIKFYDTANTTTTMVQLAYTQLGTPYATNVANVWTNASGLVVTNTLPGIYTPSSTVSQATNERPYVLQLTVAASGTINLTDVNREVGMGLAVLPNQAGQYMLTYSKLSP